MSLGTRKTSRQKTLWTPTCDLVEAPGHPFYRKLNEVFARKSFDTHVEKLCEPYYAENMGRPGIPPGVYFRMLLVGYFEGIGSQRGIAWRCADSLSLRNFLGYGMDESTPDHSSLTKIRNRLPLTVHREVFDFVLRMAADEGLITGKTIGVDATTLEANAAMKSIVRRETGEDWTEYVKRLMAEETDKEEGGPPTDEDARRFDRKRGSSKKVSNKEWESPSAPDARITKMKDGRTHLAYVAQNGVDLETEIVLAADIQYADRGEADSLPGTVEQAETNARKALDEEPEDPEDRIVKEAVTDKGYHKAEVLADCSEAGVRTYIPERRPGMRRRWTDKPPGWQEAVYGNRRRTRGERGKRLQRARSEVLERGFAHICETGGARRSWLRGLLEVKKRYLIQVAAHNLGLIMRKLCGCGKPRALAGVAGTFESVFSALFVLWEKIVRPLWRSIGPNPALIVRTQNRVHRQGLIWSPVENPSSSTGC